MKEGVAPVHRDSQQPDMVKRLSIKKVRRAQSFMGFVFHQVFG
jgi:hypothetical protein